MKDEDKTRDQLVQELSQLRRQVAQLQATGGALAPDEQLRCGGEAEYRLLVKNLPNVVFKGYQDWSVDFINDKIESLTGYPKEEFHNEKQNLAGYRFRG